MVNEQSGKILALIEKVRIVFGCIFLNPSRKKRKMVTLKSKIDKILNERIK